MTTVLAASALCRPATGTEGAPGERSALTPGWVAFDDAGIVDVGRGPAPSGATDVGDVILAPGYVDLQCNGTGSDDFALADVEGWRRVATVLASHGVTAHCPTIVSSDRDRYDGVMTVARTAATAAPGVSTSLGLHLEGPFLGDAPGAHDPAHVAPVDRAWLADLLARYPGVVRLLTLAPEADPTGTTIRSLVADGVTVALGHSTASYDAARAAIEAGATVATHLFNAMGALHQREPGLAGAALDDERVTPTLIADLVHVHPALIRLAFARRPDLALVSDSVAVGGNVVARDGAAFLADGTLAGATLFLDGAVAAAVVAGIAPARAIEAATAVPARLVGAQDHGRLDPGARADLIALDRTTFAVRRVWSAGVEIAAAQ